MHIVKRHLTNILISDLFAYFGVVCTVFIPIIILLIQDGTELRIDRLVIIENVISLGWYMGIISSILIVALLKIIMGKMSNILAIIINIMLLALLALFTWCSIIAFSNSVQWLSDNPISMASDNSYTSNPELSKKLDELQDLNNDDFIVVRPINMVSYKKRSRLAYINKTKTISDKELLWEMFWNDQNTYEYEGKNELWIYARAFWLFLSDIDDDNIIVAKQGFKTLSSHVVDIGTCVDEYDLCSYMSSLLVMLKTESSDWRAQLWAELVGEYIKVALINTKINENTRICWLGSLPQYLSDEKLDVGGDSHLELLSTTLWGSYNSFDVQNSEAHALFYPDVPQYIVDFYTALSRAKDANDFYEYMKNAGYN